MIDLARQFRWFFPLIWDITLCKGPILKFISYKFEPSVQKAFDLICSAVLPISGLVWKVVSAHASFREQLEHDWSTRTRRRYSSVLMVVGVRGLFVFSALVLCAAIQRGGTWQGWHFGKWLLGLYYTLVLQMLCKYDHKLSWLILGVGSRGQGSWNKRPISKEFIINPSYKWQRGVNFHWNTS